MRRRTLYAMAVLLLPLSMLVGVGGASAQTNGNGSTIGLCATTNSTVDLGTYNVGAVVKAHLVPICLWDVGSAVTVVVNGQTVGTKAADAAGGINVSITVQSATQLSVDDPVIVSGHCGANSVSGTGVSSAAQSTVTVTGIFTVLCPAVTATSGLAFTGADIARWAAIAVALVIVGFFMVRLVRRRRSSEVAA